jgi:transcription initiation factor TFIIF subunit alpha
MNQQPPGPNGAPSGPVTNGGPPQRRPARPPPTLFRKVNNRKNPAPVTVPVPPRPTPTAHAPAPFRNGPPPQQQVNPGEVSGFSDPRVQSENIPFKDYRVVVARKDLLQMRHHLMHMAYDGPIDIRNSDVFQRPVHLQRRDPRAKPKKQVKDEDDPPRDGLTPDARAEYDRKKEQRRKEREENLAQVAPSLNTQKKISNKKRFGQVHAPKFTDEEKRRIQLTYEEKLPWILEDWNGEKAFVAKHQSGSTKTQAAFTFDPLTGRYRLIPVEKVFNFQPKKEEAERPELTYEELELAMKKKHILPDLLARQEEARIQKRQKEREAILSKGLYTGAGKFADASRGGEDGDMDFEDDFADDEEGDIFGDDDEDKKAADKKIKEDQLQANFLDFKDIREYDQADEQEERERTAIKENFRGVRKALVKRERNYNQGSDSDEEDDWTDSSEERERLEAEKQKKEEDASRVPSGANTPSGRKEKTGSDRDSKKPRLKRPGSPNLSDASATDASVARKKKKTKHVSSTQPTPGPSRPISPDNANLDPNAARLPRSSSFASQSAAGSDTDGGAMSDGTRRLKKKAKPNPARTTSPASRPTSPPPQEYTSAFFASIIPEGGIPTREFISKAGLGKGLKEYLALISEVAIFDNGLVRLRHPAGGSASAPRSTGA